MRSGDRARLISSLHGNALVHTRLRMLPRLNTFIVVMKPAMTSPHGQ